MKERYSSPLSPKEIRAVVEHLRRGEVGLFPTETVYGLGCRADNLVGTATIYRLKGRPLDKTLPLLIGGWNQFESLCAKLKPAYLKRLEKLWPGALTVVVRATPAARSFSFHCIKEETVALRMPDHPTLRYVIEQVGIPLAATSANRSGGMEALSLEMVSPSIAGNVGWAWSEIIPQIPGRSGASTVVDLTEAKPKILREGSIKF